MSFAVWLNLIKNAEKKSVISGKSRKIHYKFPNGSQMAEEYSMDTGVCIRRGFKIEKTLKNTDNWEMEVGESPAGLSDDTFMLKESNTEPCLTKRITKKNIEFRIRNLPYPIETYSVAANPETKKITVRTSNKKYFKNITIEELERCDLLPSQANISFTHQFNTLIITVNIFYLNLISSETNLIFPSVPKTSACIRDGESSSFGAQRCRNNLRSRY